MSSKEINELKRLLGERGVDYWDHGNEIAFRHDEKYNNIWNCNGELVMTVYPVAPEQAVEATLGRGECHDKNGFDREFGFECTACGTTTDGYMVTTLNVGREMQFRFCPFCGRRVVVA